MLQEAKFMSQFAIYYDCIIYLHVISLRRVDSFDLQFENQINNLIKDTRKNGSLAL